MFQKGFLRGRCHKLLISSAFAFIWKLFISADFLFLSNEQAAAEFSYENFRFSFFSRFMRGFPPNLKLR